ncbi:hypothetical protein E3Q22_02128 [Wallemia mellicola]|uniref:F-box domain-containing protein n=1 Tax=Wallemia mellicola TaxID=1708541 RepID=A0A4T0PLZ9_9BASI|nr:hypothetical protein E3Q23_01610 [Wallemia mellicola]TIB80002.1 hypothetical protein E3Q22_02128 [Wallemia mellicola]TIB96032.1 hypothetical protein E3Q17_04043 [Wallemia mellicola]TIC11886.1 hypothetical protein E3Q14_02067 [Wallemia mellicola]TIC31055.1 hypothetical protein E3Q10_01908 [Wallemia mellicola]
MTEVLLPTKIPTFSSIFTRYAPRKSSLVKDYRPVQQKNTQFNLLKLPNELIELITDELTFNQNLVISSLNRRLRLLAYKKLFRHTKFHGPIDDSSLNLIGKYIRHLTVTFDPKELPQLHNLRAIEYLSNDPLTSSSLGQFALTSKLISLTLDITIVHPSRDFHLPTKLKHLKLSFRDDKDVHGNEPPDNMEDYTEDQIWFTIVLMSKLVQINSATLETLHLKLLLPIDTLSNASWPNLKELSVVRSFPNNNFILFLTRAPKLETLIIHGRPNNSHWITHSSDCFNGHKLLGSLKHLTLAAKPVEDDQLFSHLNTSLESFTIEDQLSTRSSHIILDNLRGIKLQVLRIEPLVTSLDWLMAVTDTLPTLRELHSKFSKLRKLRNESLEMYIEVLARFRQLDTLSLGWDLDEESDEPYTIIERDITMKKTEFYNNLAFISAKNKKPGLNNILSPSESSSSLTQTRKSSYDSQVTYMSSTSLSDLSSFGFTSPHPGSDVTVDTLRDEIRTQWNRRSNDRYWNFIETLSKRMTTLKSVNLKRFNAFGDREEITFTLDNGRIKSGNWIPALGFPSKSQAFSL